MVENSAYPDGADLLGRLTEGSILEGPHWTEPVRVLTAKARGSRIEVQAVGTHTKRLWTKLLKPEEFDETIKFTQAGELAPASLIDTLHRLCAFREKGDTEGMAQFLGRSGHANNHALWLVAQAVSEILPDGEKEKQLMQGVLNQREGLEEATRQGKLF